MALPFAVTDFAQINKTHIRQHFPSCNEIQQGEHLAQVLVHGTEEQKIKIFIKKKIKIQETFPVSINSVSFQ